MLHARLVLKIVDIRIMRRAIGLCVVVGSGGPLSRGSATTFYNTT